MADTTTANYGWTKPEVSASNNTWGTKLNADLDAIDAKIKTIDFATGAAKTTLVNADQIPMRDSAASLAAKYITWQNFLAQIVAQITLDGSDITSGTISDDRLPTTMAGKTFNGNIQVNNGNFIIRSFAPIIHLQESDESDKNWFIIADGTGFSIRENSTATARLTIGAGGGNDSLVYNTHVIWHAGNDGTGSGLDADVLDGQHGSFYRNASNTNAGTLGDAFLPTTMSEKTFNNSVAINSAGNSSLYYQQNGTYRVEAKFDTNVNEWQLHLFNNVGTWQRNIGFDMDTGAFSIGGFIHCHGEVRAGTTVLQTGGNIEFAPGGWMAANFGPYLSDALNARIKNDGGSYNINVNGTAAAVKQNGGPYAILFNWSGQSGQPNWLWGGNDGTNMYVYNPSNFSVNYANSAGNADTVDGLHASSFMPYPYTGEVQDEVNFPIGHSVLFSGHHARNQGVNIYNSAGGDPNTYNYSGVGSLLSGSWRMRGSFSSPNLGMAQRFA